jgi:hypothetical protein
MYFLLYAHNVPVRGKTVSAIYDLHGGAITRIPNVLFDIVQRLVHEPVEAVRECYHYDVASFDQYLKFLQAKNLGFWTDEPERFPATEFVWRYPGLLTHAVLEYEFDHYALPEVLVQLDNLLCRHLELRLDLAGRSAEALWQLLTPLAQSSFKTITLFIRYAEATPPELLDELFATQPKLTHIFCHSAPATVRSTQHARVLTTRWRLGPDDAPAALPAPRYVVSPAYFAEAQQHNPYYNGKVCVSRRGQLKNCLRHARSFGQVQTEPLRQLITQADFQDLWHACPDKIEGLRDSELRYATYLPQELRQVGPELYEVIEEVGVLADA